MAHCGIAEITPQPVHPRRRVIGAALVALGLLGLPFAGLMALLTANPCGAFGDACEDVGGTGDGFGWFVLLGVVALVVLGAAVMDSTRLACAAVPTPDPADDDR